MGPTATTDGGAWSSLSTVHGGWGTQQPPKTTQKAGTLTQEPPHAADAPPQATRRADRAPQAVGLPNAVQRPTSSSSVAEWSDQLLLAPVSRSGCSPRADDNCSSMGEEGLLGRNFKRLWRPPQSTVHGKIGTGR